MSSFVVFTLPKSETPASPRWSLPSPFPPRPNSSYTSSKPTPDPPSKTLPSQAILNPSTLLLPLSSASGTSSVSSRCIVRTASRPYTAIVATDCQRASCSAVGFILCATRGSGWVCVSRRGERTGGPGGLGGLGGLVTSKRLICDEWSGLGVKLARQVVGKIVDPAQ